MCFVPLQFRNCFISLNKSEVLSGFLASAKPHIYQYSTASAIFAMIASCRPFDAIPAKTKSQDGAGVSVEKVVVGVPREVVSSSCLPKSILMNETGDAIKDCRSTRCALLDSYTSRHMSSNEELPCFIIHYDEESKRNTW